MYTNMFEIQDNNGVIHSGGQNEMEQAFEIMSSPDSFAPETVEIWMTEWEGDLKLVQIHSLI